MRQSSHADQGLRVGLKRENNKQEDKTHCEIPGNFLKCNLAGV